MHFSIEEFTQRLTAVQSDIRQRDLDGILLFAPESHYYLTGYDTFGFALYQCMILPAEGLPHLLTREPDRRQAQQTSTLSDDQIHIWIDREGCDPHGDTLQLLGALGLQGKRLGIETRTTGLTAWNWQKLVEAVGTNVTLVEASDLVGLRRRIKSPAEIDYTRRAAELSDAALQAGEQATRAGAFEGDILSAMQGAVFAGGGDYAGNEFIIGSGQGALLCRYFSGRRHLDPQDQLTLEWSGAYRRYHAAMMRTLVVGPRKEEQIRMHATAIEALEACEDTIRPGAPMGDVFDAHARVFDKNGYAHARLNACGYGMGAIYNPIWVDYPMFYAGNPLLMQVGNVFFLHMVLMDSATGLAMCWGHSVLVTDQGAERLSRHSLALDQH
ncbi:MAG: Xaa-Pro peptidase family protein [Granulosicoccus sp.]|nr:Xaa-Pro peptidase family protein [Granulosicoccus sp.]